MDNYTSTIIFVGSFAIIALASKQIGAFFTRYNLPLISGFLFAGILVGPFVLNLVPHEALENLHFVDEISLAFIAFAAGSELYLKELRSRFKSITWVTAGLVLATFTLGSTAVFLLSDFIPFTQSMSASNRLAVAILAGAILVARSPSSAIAIVNELRAKGPFTQTVMGVTVIMDVVVIILFAINSEIADALLTNLNVNAGFVALLLGELSLSLVLGYLLGRFIHFVLSLNFNSHLKAGILLLLGYSVFIASALVRNFSYANLSNELLLEPLLICMISSFVVINWSPHRDEMLSILHDVGPAIYIAFFTLTGASLSLDVLAKTWPIALTLFFVRLFSIFIGSLSGGTIAREPMRHNLVSWMAFVTQAGVGLGLAKEVAVEFPEFGQDFATIIISIIVLNQIVGPPFFKWVISYVKEAHPRGETSFDGRRDALIFGTDHQALAVARQLKAHGWQIKFACTDAACATWNDAESPMHLLPSIDLDSLQAIGAAQADAIVAMLTDEENYQLCELFYEHYGTEPMVVRLNDLANLERFQKLGALTVDPGTATIGLLEQFVRSPSTASLLLAMNGEQQMVDIVVRDPDLHGMALRDLHLPLDTLIVSVHRKGHAIVSHGYTRLKAGDKVTVIGSPESLEAVILKFEA
ncbi:MAG: potassium transporter TrkA [Chloroflexi bacterium]|nr:potassium transporter TrkA [Chloroflexota bacterium]